MFAEVEGRPWTITARVSICKLIYLESKGELIIRLEFLLNSMYTKSSIKKLFKTYIRPF